MRKLNDDLMGGDASASELAARALRHLGFIENPSPLGLRQQFPKRQCHHLGAVDHVVDPTHSSGWCARSRMPGP
jgi:hypothetical protein